MNKPRTIHNADGSKVTIGRDGVHVHIKDSAPIQGDKKEGAISRFIAKILGVFSALLIASNVHAISMVSGDITYQPATNVFISSDNATSAIGASVLLSQRSVAAGKTFFVQHMEASVYLTAPSSTTFINLGNLAIFSGGVRIASNTFMGGYQQTPRWFVDFAQPLQVSSGTVITSSGTANTGSAVTWQTSFIGYEQ